MNKTGNIEDRTIGIMQVNVTFNVNYLPENTDESKLFDNFIGYLNETLLDCDDTNMPTDGGRFGVSAVKTGEDQLIPISLNHFDTDGEQADTTVELLSRNEISDILDHAIQLVQVKTNGGDDSEVFDELREAMVNAELITDDQNK